MPTTTPTLTDRYVATALRTLPERQRPDIERELRASIGDAVDARVDAGEAQADAEHAVLVELGDPDALAARYADRPQTLIGPATYPHWKRMLRLLLAIVLPVSVAIDTAVSLLTREGVGELMAGVVTTILFVGIQLCFWVTAVFWLLDRTQALPSYRWDPSQLPTFADTQNSSVRSEGIAAAVWSALLIGLIVWQQFASFFVEDGRPVPLLEPSHWTLWWPAVVALVAVEAAIAVLAMRARRWTLRLLGAHLAVQVALTAIGLYLLLTRQFFNPAFLERLDWDTDAVEAFDLLGWADASGPETILASGAILALLISFAVDLAQTIQRAIRLRRDRTHA